MGKELIKTKAITSLIETIRNEIEHGKTNIQNTIETEKTKTYWNIGKHIHEHLLDYQDKAVYGDYLFKTIALELKISKRALYRAVQFHETYPKIVPALAQLTWTHYTLLLSVDDEEKRKEYEQLVIDNVLSTRELEELIKKDTKNKHKKLVLNEKRGFLNTYRLKKIKTGTLCIDLGFRIYTDIIDKRKKYKENDIIQVKKINNITTMTETNEAAFAFIYTYRGMVKEVIDGDTLWIDIDLGFNTWTCQKLRFKSINAAKISTKKGIQAKQFIENALNPCEFIIVKTYYRDKYNRYLSDIFYDKNERNIFKVAEKGTYLNQELIDKGFAVKY